MQSVPIHIVMKACWESGVRIYPKFHSAGMYIICVSKKVKKAWNLIPANERSNYERIEGEVFLVQKGTELYPENLKVGGESYVKKIEELYRHVYEKIQTS